MSSGYNRIMAKSNALSALRPLDDDKRAKAIKFMEYYAAGQAVWKLGRRTYAMWDERRQYTVTVNSDDAIYEAVQEWLLTQVPQNKQRTVVAQTMYGQRVADEDDVWDMLNDSNEGNTASLGRRLDDTEMRVLIIDGHKIRVYLNKADDEDSLSSKSYVVKRPDMLHFISVSVAGQQAVLDLLSTMVSTTLVTKRKPRLNVMGSHGHFNYRTDLPARSIDSVVLREGQLDRITTDLQRFLDSEREYVRRGIPWHRGYLLEGPPGTGKTSIARALAGHFGLDMYYAPLGDVKNDTSLMDLIGSVKPRSVLLLEDVDVFAAATSRESEKGEVSLSGFLNALDGISTPHGLIVILTSNNKSALDPALVRPGRIDLVETIGMPDTDQATRLFEYFYGESPERPIKPHGKSPSALIEVFKQHMYDSKAAEVALHTDRKLT